MALLFSCVWLETDDILPVGAKVTTRRAHKGFTLRYNPDGHWSNCFYKGLNTLQYKDGSDLTNINRDDASRFHVHTQYANPVVQGHDIVTTRTDYVNKYPLVLQTTSYNFSCTDNTRSLCGRGQSNWYISKESCSTCL